MSPVNLLETVPTRKFLDSVTALTLQVSVSAARDAVPHIRPLINDRSLYSGAISFRLWLVHREARKAGLCVEDSIIMVRITTHPMFIAQKN